MMEIQIQEMDVQNFARLDQGILVLENQVLVF